MLRDILKWGGGGRALRDFLKWGALRDIVMDNCNGHLSETGPGELFPFRLVYNQDQNTIGSEQF